MSGGGDEYHQGLGFKGLRVWGFRGLGFLGFRV